MIRFVDERGRVLNPCQPRVLRRILIELQICALELQGRVPVPRRRRLSRQLRIASMLAAPVSSPSSGSASEQVAVETPSFGNFPPIDFGDLDTEEDPFFGPNPPAGDVDESRFDEPEDPFDSRYRPGGAVVRDRSGSLAPATATPLDPFVIPIAEADPIKDFIAGVSAFAADLFGLEEPTISEQLARNQGTSVPVVHVELFGGMLGGGQTRAVEK